ncbi:MAG: polymorphic outer membrane protein, partial [Verrucomicrobiota bacterium]
SVTIAADSGSAMTLSGAVNLNTGTMTIGGDGSTLMSGAVTNGSVTKSGAGTVTFSNTSTSFGTLTTGTGETAFATNATVTGLSGSGALNLVGGTLTLSNTTAQSFSGAISGSGGLTKRGAGTLTVSGSSTYSGATLIAAGGLTVGASNSLPTGAAVTVGTSGATANGGRFNIGNGLSQTIGSLTLLGGNTSEVNSGQVLIGAGSALVLTGNITYETGGNNRYRSYISGGTLDLGGATNTVTVNDNNNTADLEIDSVIANGSLAKAGAGILQLDAANTLSGTVLLSAGTLALNNANALQNATLDLGSSGTRDTTFVVSGATTYNIGALAGADALAISNNTLSIGANNTSLSMTGAITGTGGSITKVGTGTLTLANSGSTYSGQTTVNNGTLRVQTSASTLGTSALVLAGGNLELAAGATTSFGNNTTLSNNTTITADRTSAGGTANYTLGTLSIGAQTLDLARGTNYTSGTSGLIFGATTLRSSGATFNVIDANSALTLGAVSGSGFSFTVGGFGSATISNITTGAGSVTKSGAGTLTLGGTNTYSGGTLVSAGGLSGSTTSLQGAITNNGTVIFSQTTNGTYAGTMSGAGGALTKSGSGTLTMTAANTFSGPTTVTAGRLLVNGTNASSAVTMNTNASLGGSGRVGDLTVSGLLAPGNSVGSLSAGSTILNTGGSFELEIFDFTGSAGTGWDLLAVNGDLTLSNTSVSPFTLSLVSMSTTNTTGSAINFNANQSYTNTFLTYSGSLLGNAFGTNLFTLNTNSFANALNGAFSIANVGQSLALVYSTFYVPPSSFTWSAGSGLWSDTNNWSEASAPTAGAGIVFAGAAGGNSTNDQVNSVIGLNFSNTAGSFTVSGNAMTNGAAGVVNNSSNAQTINNNLTLGAVQTFNSASGDLAFGGAVTNNGNLLTVAGAANTLISGAISGSGSLTKAGAGTLTLSGANTYNGGTTVSAGRLVGDSTSLQGAILNNAAVTFNQVTNGTYGGVLSGTGSLAKQGSGTLLLSVSNSYSGGTTVDAGTIQINGANRLGATAGALTINDGELQLISQSISSARNIVLGNANSAIEVDAGLRYTATNTSVVSGTGTLNKRGAGTLSLYGTNSYNGGNVIAAGALEGDTTSLRGAISNNGVVSFLQATNGNYSSAITGTGSLNKSGVGSLTLGGANSYSGGTLVSAGSLIGSTASLQGAITNNATVVMTQSANGTYGGALSGNGGFTKSGSGTVTLGGNNSGYGGAIDLQAGGLVAAHNNALGTGAVILTNGGIQAATGVSIANSFTIGASGGVITNSTTNAFTAYWNFGTNTGNASATNTSGTGITFSAVSQGNNNGTTTMLSSTSPSDTYTNASGGFNAAAAARTGSLSTGANGSAYFEFSLTASNGFNLSLTNLTFGSRSTSTAPQLATLLSSIDSYAAALATNALGVNIGWGLIAPSVTASALTNGTVTFRIYGSAGTGSPGVNTANWRIDDLNLAGFSVTNLVTTNAPTGSGTLGIAEAGTATFSGNILNNTAATLTAATDGQAVFSGVISGEGFVTKTGAGTVTLSGSAANTFRGTTTVSQGVLELTKTAGVNAIASTNITVSKVDNNNRATLLLSANDQVANTTTVTLSGGTIQRGNGVSEVFGNLNLTEASFLDFGLGNVGMIGFGTYTPSALTALNIVNFAQGNTLTFRSNLTDSITSSAFVFSGAGGLGSYSWDQGTTTFTITAIPEPSTWITVAGMIGLFYWPSRKRIVRDIRRMFRSRTRA